MFISMYSIYDVYTVTNWVEQTGQPSTMTTPGAFSLQDYHLSPHMFFFWPQKKNHRSDHSDHI